MRSTVSFGIAALLSLLLLSCGGSKDIPTASDGAGKILAMDEGSGQLALEKKFADYGKDVVLDEDGRVQKDSKRSSFEGKQMTNIGGSYANKEFAANRYSKKNWSGSKNFDRTKFQSSKNRWDDEEWFMQKQARESGASSLAQTQNYSTNNYGTSSAREQAGTRLARSSDVETDVRNRVFQQPLKIEKEDYEKMSLEDSRSLLGR